MSARILIVDDDERNRRLLFDVLEARGYSCIKAESGERGLMHVRADRPDLVLLDVMMPGLNGYEVCKAIRADPVNAMLPIVMVTALDGEERIKGLAAGADDFLSKPINQPELLARVKSLLRIKTLYDEVQRQRHQLEAWNKVLEGRVADGVAQMERMLRMKRFLSPQVAEIILQDNTEDPLRSHRSEITVVFLDLRGYTAFTESAEPEDVMNVLHDYHQAMGQRVVEHQGTLERFAGDGIMIFFNDPLPLPNPAESAVRMAMQMHESFAELQKGWMRKGYDLDMGIGIAQGYATIGAIGFEERMDYGAIGAVTNLAARLCAEARAGQTLVSQKVLAKVATRVEVEHVGDLNLKGFQKPVPAFNITRFS
jgi:adenylate cyclase